jgi:hypothetical protein
MRRVIFFRKGYRAITVPSSNRVFDLSNAAGQWTTGDNDSAGSFDPAFSKQATV